MCVAGHSLKPVLGGGVRSSLLDAPGLVAYAPDGSLTIYMQHESPGPDKEANWLPAPEGEFRLALRLYIPDKRVVDRAWVPSPVRKLTD